ncbi:hypothetical protein, partial [Aeromonas veronii]|uniref:hypothetical protein n=1 Tax=Aeromonas veronii TaxID=654 RepID=UPI003D1E0318
QKAPSVTVTWGWGSHDFLADLGNNAQLIDIEMPPQLNIPPLVIPLFGKTRLPLTLRIITPPH